jgi:hypothetical protein
MYDVFAYVLCWCIYMSIGAVLSKKQSKIAALMNREYLYVYAWVVFGFWAVILIGLAIFNTSTLTGCIVMVVHVIFAETLLFIKAKRLGYKNGAAIYKEAEAKYNASTTLHIVDK